MPPKSKTPEPKKEIAIVTALSEPMAMADVFMQSGMFTDIKSQSQAVVKILAGRELGLAPLESMTNIYIVNGKVALQAKIIGSLIKRSKKYDYIIEKLDDKECVISFFQIDGHGEKKELGKSSFSYQDAAKAGLVNKDSYKNYPRNMLFSRALSNGSKWHCPEVFCGYSESEIEEIGGDVNSKPIKIITLKENGEIKTNEKSDERNLETNNQV